MSSVSDVQKARLVQEPEAMERRSSLNSQRLHWIALTVWLVLSDVLFMGLAFRAAYWLRFETLIPIFRLEVEPSLRYYESLVFLMLPLWIGVFALLGLYDRDNLLGGIKEYALLWRGTIFSMMLVIVVGFLEPNLLIARGFLLLAWIFTFLFASLGRFLLRRLVYRLRAHGYFLAPTLIVGANEEGQLLARQLLDWSSSGLNLKGMIETNGADSGVGMKELCVGRLEDLDEVVREFGIREMVLATSSLTRDEMLSVFRRYGVSESINLRLSSGLFEIITTGLQVKELAYVPLVSVEKVRLTGFNRVLKAVLDYSIASLALLLLSPLLLLISIAVRFSSPGPILHRRKVMGINGRKFDAFKFRTMYMDADGILGQNTELRRQFEVNHKLRDDPRVTKVGGLLRRFSLDELPQLFNVLKGEMSIVGPRMISPEEMARYEKWGLNLLTVKPGITGLWQVSGRSDISYDRRVKMDMYYIRNWTIWFDLYLLIQTIPAVLKARGAY